MSRIAFYTDDDTTKVKFCSLSVAEVFVYKGDTYFKLDAEGLNVISLKNGEMYHMDDDTLVTFVRRAELMLTI